MATRAYPPARVVICPKGHRRSRPPSLTGTHGAVRTGHAALDPGGRDGGSVNAGGAPHQAERGLVSARCEHEPHSGLLRGTSSAIMAARTRDSIAVRRSGASPVVATGTPPTVGGSSSGRGSKWCPSWCAIWLLGPGVRQMSGDERDVSSFRLASRFTVPGASGFRDNCDVTAMSPRARGRPSLRPGRRWRPCGVHETDPIAGRV